MPLFLEVKGKRYTHFESIEVNRSLNTLSGSFSFTTTVDTPNGFPIKLGQKCRVIAEKELSGSDKSSLEAFLPSFSAGSTSGAASSIASFLGDEPSVVIDGYVETISVSADSPGSHSITIDGRDKTGDLIDSQVAKGSGIGARKGTSAKEAIERVLENTGFMDVKVLVYPDSFVPPGLQFKTDDPQTGDRILDAINNIATSVPVMITGSSPGNITLEKPGGDTAGVPILNVIGGEDNNVIRMSYQETTVNRFSKYTAHADTKVSLLGGSASEDSSATDKDIRVTRKMVFTGPKVSVKDTPKWELNTRKANGTTYRCTLHGHFSDGEETIPWRPGQKVYIADDFAGLNKHMLLSSVRFSYDADKGSTSELEFVGVGAYELQTPTEPSTSFGIG